MIRQMDARNPVFLHMGTGEDSRGQNWLQDTANKNEGSTKKVGKTNTGSEARIKPIGN